MTNINQLEKLRTKKEVLNYFKKLGKIITEEEIENLKSSYEQDEENSDNLTMHQLDGIAGGIYGVTDGKCISFQPGKPDIPPGQSVRMAELKFFLPDDPSKPARFHSFKPILLTPDSSSKIQNDPKFFPVNYVNIDQFVYFNINPDNIIGEDKRIIAAYVDHFQFNSIINGIGVFPEEGFDYDKNQLANLRKWVEAATSPLPPAPAA